MDEWMNDIMLRIKGVGGYLFILYQTAYDIKGSKYTG